MINAEGKEKQASSPVERTGFTAKQRKLEDKLVQNIQAEVEIISSSLPRFNTVLVIDQSINTEKNQSSGQYNYQEEASYVLNNKVQSEELIEWRETDNRNKTKDNKLVIVDVP